MPTKTRLVLKDSQRRTFTGKRALQLLCQSTQISLLSRALPANWNKMTAIARMKVLAQNLPKGYVFKIYKEPKGTRPNKSLYRAAVFNQ